MLFPARIAGALTVLAVVAMTMAAAALTGAGSGTTIGGSAARAAPYQVPLAQNLAAVKQNPAQTNAVYVPITPCRIMDTRLAGGRFGDNTTRTYTIAGTSGFTAQGGNSTGCGIPLAATAVAATITANTPSDRGYVRAWPSAIATEPNATVLNYSPGEQTTAGSVLAITPGVAKSLKLRNHHGPVDLALDVTGYYEPPMHGMVSPGTSTNAPIYAGSSRIVSATNPSAGVYVVTFDSPITYCTPIVDTYNAGSGVYGAAYAFSGSTATVFTWYLDSATHATTLYSYYFYIAIIC